MTGRSANQVDMSILPGVEEYPMRLIPRYVNDSAIANNHRVDDFIGPFSWYGCTDDGWMRCPSRETDSLQLDKRQVVHWHTGQSQESSATEPTNNPHTHLLTNARSCSTENTKQFHVPYQLSFTITVQASLSISGWKVRRSRYAYPAIAYPPSGAVQNLMKKSS
jgi:hypothetical protein